MVKNKKSKKISLHRVLLRKLRQDLKVNILQYLAIIFIAALAISLFTGLAANYRVFQARVNKVYKDGNIADLWYTTNNISSELENNVRKNLSSGDTFEKRVVIPVNISDPVKKDSVIDSNYNLIINDDNFKLNTISNYYKVLPNGHKQVIKPKEYNLPTIFLPYSMIVNTEIGSSVVAKLPFSVFVQQFLGKDSVIETDTVGATGKIINSKTGKKIDLKSYANFLSTFVLASHCVDGNLKNNIINDTLVTKFLNKAIDSNTYFEMEFILGGYVDQPESVYRNSIAKFAFTSRKHLIKAVQTSINKFKTSYQDETALVDLLIFILEIPKLKDVSSSPEDMEKLENIQQRLNHRYTPAFFDYTKSSSFIRQIEDLIVQFGYLFPGVDTKSNLSTKQQLLSNFTQKINYLKTDYYNQFLIQFQNRDYRHVNSKKEIVDNLFLLPDVVASNSTLLLSQNTDELYSNQVVQSDLIQSNKLMYVFPLIFFLVSFLVIISTTSQMILKERIQIGTLKSLGITKREITSYYSLRSVIVVMIGTFLGFLTGPFALPYIMDSKYKLLYNLPDIKIVFPWLETIIITVIFLVLVSLISVVLLSQEIRTNPSTLMRPKIIKIKFKPRKYKKNSSSISRRIAIRNIRTNPFRSLMTIIGVMGCCALVLVGLGISDTIDYGITHDMSRYYNCDLVIRYQAGAGDKLSNYLMHNKDVAAYENFYSQPVNITNPQAENGKQVTSIATSFINNSTFYKPSKNEKPSFGKTNISKRVAEKIGVTIGDKIKIITFEQQEFTLEIERVLDAFFVQGVVFNLDDPACGKLIDSAKISYVRFQSGVNHLDASRAIEAQDFVVKAYTNESNQKLISDVMGSIRVATSMILVFAVLLAAIVLYNLMKLNLNQRQREIATLKVLGFNHNEITKSIMIETMLLTLIGVVLGLLLGYPFLILVMKINETDVVTYLYKIFFESFVLASTCLLLSAYIISSVVSNTIRWFKTVEMLKSVE